MSTSTRPVLLLAETGFIIRNLVLGTFLPHVAAKRPVVIAVPKPDDAELCRLVAPYHIRLIQFERRSLVAPRTRFGRATSLDGLMHRLKAGQRNTASIALQSKLWDGDHSPMAKRAIAAARHAAKALDQLGLMGPLEDGYLFATAHRAMSRRWRAILKELRPAVVVSTMLSHAMPYNASSDLAVAVAAHSLGIPVGTLIQSWDNLTSKTSVLPPWLDRYWAWSETMRSQLLAMNPRVPADSITVIGGPQFDYHGSATLHEPRESFVRELGLDPTRPYLVIGTGTETWLPGEPKTVLQLVTALERELPDVQVLLRLHPKDGGARWSNYEAVLRAKRVVVQHTAPELHLDLGGFATPQQFYRTQVNTLVHAAVVLNTASTLTVDAAILDKPVICFSYDVEPDSRFPEGRARAYAGSSHYAPLVETGGVVVAASEAACVAAIKAYIRDPSRDRAGRIAIANTVTATTDGRAGERLANDVLRLAST